MSVEAALSQLSAQVGREVHVSDWLEVTQARIDELSTQLDSLEAYMGADGPGG